MSATLRDYQVADLSFYMQTPRCMNLSDPGTGKTPSVCVYASYHWFEKKNRTVWIQPKGLLKKNRDEMLIFSGFKPEDVVIVDNINPKKRIKAIESNAKVFLIGFTAFTKLWPYLLRQHPDVQLCLVDEFHMGYGGHDSQRTTALYAAMEHIKYFVAMTGTIINGRLSSAYPAIEICDPTLYHSYESFMYAHAIEDDYGRVVDWRGHERLRPIFRKYAIRHSFEEVYGPEAKVIIPEVVEMTPRQKEAYEEFEEAALLELEDSWLDGSTNQAVYTIRCRQIMEHPQTLGAPLDEIKQTGKEERLEIHLADCKQSGKPMIVFAALQPQIERAAEMARKMGLRVGMIHGGVSNSKRFQIDEQFRAGQLDVVVASPATTAVGYNWGHVDVIVFLSLDYMDSSFVQGYRRAIRGVRERPCLIYVLQYDCAVEKRIIQIVEKKAAMAAKVDETKNELSLRAEKPKPEAKAETFKALRIEDLL